MAENEDVTIVAPKKVKDISAVSGSDSQPFTQTLIQQTANSLWLVHDTKEERDTKINAMVATLIGVQPQDELEGLLASQMIAAHNAAMECFRRAMIKEQGFESRNQNLKYANQLSKTYAQLMDSLNRYRGKNVCEQKLTVQHVHINEGAQAIVGNVERGGGGKK